MSKTWILIAFSPSELPNNIEAEKRSKWEGKKNRRGKINDTMSKD